MKRNSDTTSTTPNRRERLLSLRDMLDHAGITAFLIPRADQHQGEYVAPASERLAWLTGFTGSAGMAIVAAKAAALLVDGRYTLQAPAEVDGGSYEFLQVPDAKASDWIKAHVRQGGKVGFDPWLHTIDEIEQLGKTLASAGISLKPLARNPIDRLWGHERPPLPDAPVSVHPVTYAGRTAESKLAEIQATLKRDGQDAVLLTLPDSLCWAFNIRGRDVAHNPIVLAYAIVHRTGRAELFIGSSKLSAEARAHLKPLARLREPDTLAQHLGSLRTAGKVVRIDTQRASYWFLGRLGGSKRIAKGGDPCLLPKAIKNDTEVAGARQAHRRDAAALCRFLSWLDRTVLVREVDELAAARRLENERAATGELIDLSFDTISGSGPNGAIVHYRSSEATNRRLEPGELYLVDSGAQYMDGTTDVTRTIAIGTPTDEMRRAFTAVLRGHIAIATARFPRGTRGVDLDPFARRALWQAGLDYDHGTGHGVGSFLSVHEGPQSISRRGMVALEPGMIVSNEPGYYKAHAFGIRIENLVLVRPPQPVAGGEREMMSFEDLTLAPIDRRLIEVAALTSEERTWLDAYHDRVYREIGPLLNARDKLWLREVTAPLV